MKQEILTTIISLFTEWAENEDFCCGPGCATCCTCNVTLTNIEAWRILDFLTKHNLKLDKIEKIASSPIHSAYATQTTNEYVASGLAENETIHPQSESATSCPFLENNLCSIYPVRPFSCHCFASTSRCQTGGSATLPDHYLSAATVVMQLIEHLGQFSPWGNMLDMLTILSTQQKPYQQTFTTHSNETTLLMIKQRLLTAKPVPGFIIPEADHHMVWPLIEEIFKTHVGSKTIEQIFNGG